MTTTDTTVTITDNAEVIDIGGNLFRVEALIDSYGEILEQAKQQLEQLELSEADFQRISDRSMERFDYYRVARAIATELASNSECEQALHNISERVLHSINESHIRNLIREELSEIVNTRFAHLELEINRRFNTLIEGEAATARSEARSSTRMFEELFRSVFGQEIKDHIKRQANELAEDWQKRRAELDQQQAEG